MIEHGRDDCEYDSITITDGTGSSEAYCGFTRPMFHFLYTGPVTVRFVSDDSVTLPGFSLSYHQTGTYPGIMPVYVSWYHT